MLECGDNLDVNISNPFGIDVDVTISEVSDSVAALLKGVGSGSNNSVNNTVTTTISGGVGLKPGSESIRFLSIPVPTPFAINIANVEYCKGRMNPDTNRYELKIGLVSGRDLTLEGEAAMSFLSIISEDYGLDVDASKSLKAKFQSKSGS